MKMNIFQTKSLSLFMGALCCVALSASAALPRVSPGEVIIFSDDFGDSTQGWGVVKGEPLIDTDASVFGPDIGADGMIKSMLELAQPVQFSGKVTSIYIKARVDNTTDANASRFGVALLPRRIGFVIYPGRNAVLEYKDAEWNTLFSKLDRLRFPDTETFHDIKLSITPDAIDPTLGTAELFYYNVYTARYESLGQAKGVSLESANKLELFERNDASSSGAAYFDAVVLTQAPITAL
jgi:hypothetical protein